MLSIGFSKYCTQLGFFDVPDLNKYETVFVNKINEANDKTQFNPRERKKM